MVGYALELLHRVGRNAERFDPEAPFFIALKQDPVALQRALSFHLVDAGITLTFLGTLSSVPPAPDTDRDGMPDYWEIAIGLNPAVDDPTTDGIYKVGVLANVLQLLKLPDGTVKVLVEGARRGTLAQLADWTAEADKVFGGPMPAACLYAFTLPEGCAASMHFFRVSACAG